MGKIAKRPIRRKYERLKVQDVPFNKRVTNEVIPNIRISRQYDFLKYIRIVMKWATTNYEITRPHLELILYLYGEGLFTRYEYNDAHKIIGMKDSYTFKKFVDDGWITIFKEKTTTSPRLYTVTAKGKKMCSRMHKILVNEENIPESVRYNKLASEEGSTNYYYMKAIAKMNKRRKQAQEED